MLIGTVQTIHSPISLLSGACLCCAFSMELRVAYAVHSFTLYPHNNAMEQAGLRVTGPKSFSELHGRMEIWIQILLSLTITPSVSGEQARKTLFAALPNIEGNMGHPSQTIQPMNEKLKCSKGKWALRKKIKVFLLTSSVFAQVVIWMPIRPIIFNGWNSQFQISLSDSKKQPGYSALRQKLALNFHGLKEIRATVLAKWLTDGQKVHLVTLVCSGWTLHLFYLV